MSEIPAGLRMSEATLRRDLNAALRKIRENSNKIEILEAAAKEHERRLNAMEEVKCALSDMSDSPQALEQPSTTIPLVHLSRGTMLMGHWPAVGDSMDKWLQSQMEKESFRSPVRRALLNLREHYLQLARHGCSITDGRES